MRPVNDATSGDDLEAGDELHRARRAARRSEEELGQALIRLESSLRQPFAIGDRVAEAPVRWLAGAFALGFILARATRGRRDE